MPGKTRRTALHILAGLIGLMLAVPLLYGLSGLAGGAIPVNRDWRPATAGGVTIFVETNGIHTGIVVPVAAAGIDWRDLVRAEHLRAPEHAGTHLSFGWGEHDFYLNTPTWADLDVATTVRAALGSDRTLLHVDHLPPPIASAASRPVVVSVAEYHRIAAAIRARFALDAAGRSQPLPGYGDGDAFYVATGRYDALHTCNSWVGEVLRDAGVRIGAWTPFSSGVMRWF